MVENKNSILLNPSQPFSTFLHPSQPFLPKVIEIYDESKADRLFMIYRICLSVLAFWAMNHISAQNQPPVISNLNVVADWNAQTLTVQYDVADAENDPLEITVALAGDDCGNFIELPSATGDLGFPVLPGAGRMITASLSGLSPSVEHYTLRLIADDQQPFDLQALVDQVDSNRLRSDLEFVQGVRHFVAGLPHLTAVRDSITATFGQAGLCTIQKSFPYANTSGINIIGTLPGAGQAEQVVIVDAHYDTVNDAPGADDNGSGVVGVLEMARLLAPYPMQKTLRFIGFDFEEAGLSGSKKYVLDALASGEQIDGVLNLEMIGFYSEAPNSQELPAGFNLLFPSQYAAVAANQFRGDFISNVGNAASASLGMLFDSSAAQYVPDLKVISVLLPQNGQIAPDFRRSDHAPFWDAGFQALMLTDGANFRNECYHTPQDTLEKLNFTFMSNVVKATLATAAQRAGIIHGDRATATFQGFVAVSAPDPCGLALTSRPGSRELRIAVPPGCPLNPPAGSGQALRLELYDAKGVLRFQQPVSGPSTVTLPAELAAGVYVASLKHRGGQVVVKVVL
jgi:hypothetical protein